MEKIKYLFSVSKLLLFFGFIASYLANSWPVTICYLAVACVYCVESLFESKLIRKDDQTKKTLETLTQRVEQTQSLMGIKNIGKS